MCYHMLKVVGHWIGVKDRANHDLTHFPLQEYSWTNAEVLMYNAGRW